VLAPYLLTALMLSPARLVYLSSSMHFHSRPTALDKAWSDQGWTGQTSYSQSKFLVTLLTFAVARKWPDVMCNAVDPGWVPTRMGGRSAPDDLQMGCETQSWLAETGDVSGAYFHHRKERQPDPDTRNEGLQDQLLSLCQRVSGTEFP
jgi:NAD(P)-dependent dehydrogenase (short-subunit alcohol dehydrogenase family)